MHKGFAALYERVTGDRFGGLFFYGYDKHLFLFKKAQKSNNFNMIWRKDLKSEILLAKRGADNHSHGRVVEEMKHGTLRHSAQQRP